MWIIAIFRFDEAGVADGGNLHICLRHQRAASPFHFDPRVGIARLTLLVASVVAQAACHA